eukprot:6944965-Pyramimonas_sp.AAC.2
MAEKDRCAVAPVAICWTTRIIDRMWVCPPQLGVSGTLLSTNGGRTWTTGGDIRGPNGRRLLTYPHTTQVPSEPLPTNAHCAAPHRKDTARTVRAQQ